MLKACINGSRRPTEHDRLPVSANEIAADAVRVAAAGADAVHVHAKDPDGADTLSGQVVGPVLLALRAAVPRLPVGVTTGAWATADPEERLEAVKGWEVLPDFASVNWHEAGAEELADALIARGVGVEAGLWHDAAIDAWLASRTRPKCLRVLLELPDGSDEAATQRDADRWLAALAAGANELPVLLHGEGSSCWPALRHAIGRGLDTRIGLEDVLALPDGTPARDNSALVEAALTMARARGRTLS